MTSSGSSRNQKDKKFMDDVNLLIDTEIEPLVKNIIEQHKGKRISNADGTYSAIRKDVQTKKDAIMKEKNYLLWHWQTKVWNSYQAALLDHQYIRAALTATTLRDTIKPACIERIVRWNNAEIGDGARAAYYKQNKWRDIRSVAYPKSGSLLEHHGTATVPTSHAALSNMHFEAMAVIQIMTTAFIAGLALGWCLRRRCDHRNQASSGAPELPKYGATAEGHGMEEC